MRSIHSGFLRHASHQRGAILVTSMLLLLVLTIIGVTVMQMSRMQERMAGNTRDVNLAFQAAEGALRGAEAYIRGQVIRPVECSTSPCNVWSEDALAGTVANLDATWWTTNGKTFGQATMAGLDEPPTSAVEALGFVRTDGGVVMGQDPPDGRDFYQVTSRSTGGSGLAEVVLQTTYTRKF
jgi:type IV pilus assembly protein PilX